MSQQYEFGACHQQDWPALTDFSTQWRDHLHKTGTCFLTTVHTPTHPMTALEVLQQACAPHTGLCVSTSLVQERWGSQPIHLLCFAKLMSEPSLCIRMKKPILHIVCRGQRQSIWDRCQRRCSFALVMHWETSWCVPARPAQRIPKHL